MVNTQIDFSADIKFIEYVLSILADSRTKKQATNRLYGLLTLRKEQESNCVTYSEEMIKDYIQKRKEN